MEETLRDYGYSFQIKVLSALIVDRTFASRIFEIIKPEYFDSEALKWLITCILKYFQEYKSMPTLEVFKSEIVKGVDANNAVLKSEIVTALREVMKSIQSQDLEYIKEETTQFCKNQELKAALLDCIPKIKNGDYDGIRSRIEEAYKKGNEFSVGHQYLDDVEERYNKENLVHITTGWDVIDELTGGGLPKRKLGTIMGALGAGKSFLAVHLGAAAVEAGFTVIHITLELDQYEVGKRYDARLTGFGLDNIEMHIPEVRRKLNSVKGKLIIKEFLTGVTLFGIENYIDQCILLGIVPDVVIIDYDELIDTPETNLRDDQRLQFLHREARRKIAVAKNVALWIPIQASREGADEDVMRMTHAANSYGKGREADFALTLSRREKDKVSNTARISIGKSRLGPDGMSFPSHFDTSKGLVKIFREGTTEGQKQKDKMVSDEDYNKQYLLNRLRQQQDSNIMNSSRTEPDNLF
jgi:hypothetical protein